MNVLITGASRGLGLHIASHCIKENHRVVNVSRTKCEFTDNILSDLTSYDSANRIISQLDILGFYSIDCLILNAGLNDRDESQCTRESIVRHFSANTLGHVDLAMGLHERDMLPVGSNVIILGSFAAEFGHPKFVAYSMAKAALETWAISFSRYTVGLNVNILRPGRVNTPGNPIRHDVADRNAFKTVEDVWPAVHFLMSQGLNGMNGRTLDLARN